MHVVTTSLAAGQLPPELPRHPQLLLSLPSSQSMLTVIGMPRAASPSTSLHQRLVRLTPPCPPSHSLTSPGLFLLRAVAILQLLLTTVVANLILTLQPPPPTRRRPFSFPTPTESSPSLTTHCPSRPSLFAVADPPPAACSPSQTLPSSFLLHPSAQLISQCALAGFPMHSPTTYGRSHQQVTGQLEQLRSSLLMLSYAP